MSTGRNTRPPRDYARLHFRWYADEVLEAIAEEEPVAQHLVPLLIAMSKEASNAKNPEGTVPVTAAKLAMLLRLDGLGVPDGAKRVTRALKLLEEGEIVATERGRVRGLIMLRLVRFRKWNVARGTSAETSQASRDADATSRENTPLRDGDVTPTGQARDGDVTDVHSDTDLDLRPRPKTKDLTTNNRAPATAHEPAPAPEVAPDDQTPETNPDGSPRRTAWRRPTNPEGFAQAIGKIRKEIGDTVAMYADQAASAMQQHGKLATPNGEYTDLWRHLPALAKEHGNEAVIEGLTALADDAALVSKAGTWLQRVVANRAEQAAVGAGSRLTTGGGRSASSLRLPAVSKGPTEEEFEAMKRRVEAGPVKESA